MDPDATLQRQRELIKALRAINDNADAETGQLTTIQRIEAIRAASRSSKRRLAGVIGGRALYDGRLDVLSAVEALRD